METTDTKPQGIVPCTDGLAAVEAIANEALRQWDSFDIQARRVMHLDTWEAGFLAGWIAGQKAANDQVQPTKEGEK